ncbi:MAG: hypothetical protein GXO19_03465 [Epsilonproteobacteria bacterium]|nr:hypothetical protein [Campylobacterota bacterium]NPA56777.1 hypothetical protein [Campylobacterota bacterium]
MDTLFRAALHTHELALFLLIVSQLYFFKLEREERFITLVKGFRKLFMVQNVLMGIVLFTGLLMMAVQHFSVWNFKVVAMILLMVVLLVHQFLINRRLRVIRSDEVELQREWRSYASRIYLGEAVAIFLLFLVAKVVS